jgi:hypothetical protein
MKVQTTDKRSEVGLSCNILEDEYHFFLNCHLNQQPRNLLINTIENKCPSFTNMSPMNRLDYILNLIIFFIQMAYYTHMGQAITKQKHANI